MPRFDSYSLRARIAPALVVFAPALLLCLYAPQVGAIYAAIPLIFVAAGGLLAEEIVRQLGKNLENRLADRWDGLPTVRALRHRGAGNADLRKRRRSEVSQLSSIALPTSQEEEADPSGADQIYDEAVRRCLAILRKRQPKSMLSDENARYGFRRNLLALKPLAFTTMGLTAVATVWLALGQDAMLTMYASLGVVALDLALWIVFVRAPWVRAQADTLSQRLFLTIGTVD